mmetsp:Transcript_10589/g.44131  ORF Transcript_10589/g.44131 Transcript_10589/m.44131 type:complete len:115 (+) Transcript_10589:3-347(+)
MDGADLVRGWQSVLQRRSTPIISPVYCAYNGPGGQVRDDVRSTYDAGRGGYGKAAMEGYGARNGMQLWGPAGESDAMRDDEGPGRKRGREEEQMVTDAPEDIQKRRIFRRGGNR